MDILAIGNALLDIFWFTDDESALSLGLHPNHSAHVKPGRLDELLLAVQNPIFVSGGSASNAAKVASAFGLTATFVGCVGTEDRERDQWARAFEADLSASGVRCALESKTVPTGRCLVIRMPGDLKSVACSPSAATGFSPESVPPEFFSQARCVLLDGQVLRNAEVTEHIAVLARTHRVPLALDMGSADIAHTHPARVLEILKKNDVTIFMNAEEASAFAMALRGLLPECEAFCAAQIISPENSGNPIDAVDAAFGWLTREGAAHKNAELNGADFPCIVEKRGPLGARAWVAGKRLDAGVTAVDKPLDDTACGDVFDGAFVSARLRGAGIDAALAFANEAAGAVLMAPGSRLDPEAFAALRGKLAAMSPAN